MRLISFLHAHVAWKAQVAKALFLRGPWGGVILTIAAAFFLLYVSSMVWTIGLFFQLVEEHLGSGALRRYSTLPLGMAAVAAYVGGAMEFQPQIGRFWVISTSPAPRGWQALERTASALYYAALAGLPLSIAAVWGAGYPIYSAVSVVVAFGTLGFVLKAEHTVSRLFIAAIGGFATGWGTAVMLEVLLDRGPLLLLLGPEEVWGAMTPLVLAAPLPDWMQQIPELPVAVHLVAAAGFVVVAAWKSRALRTWRTESPAGLYLVRIVSKRLPARLAAAALWVGRNLESVTGGLLFFVAYIFAAGHFGLPQPPVRLQMMVAAIVVAAPLYVRGFPGLLDEPGDEDIGSVVGAGALNKKKGKAELLRGRLEFTGLVVVAFVAVGSGYWGHALALGCLLLLLSRSARWLVGFPGWLLILLIVAAGMAVLAW